MEAQQSQRKMYICQRVVAVNNMSQQGARRSISKMLVQMLSTMFQELTIQDEAYLPRQGRAARVAFWSKNQLTRDIEAQQSQRKMYICKRAVNNNMSQQGATRSISKMLVQMLSTVFQDLVIQDEAYLQRQGKVARVAFWSKNQPTRDMKAQQSQRKM